MSKAQSITDLPAPSLKPRHAMLKKKLQKIYKRVKKCKSSVTIFGTLVILALLFIYVENHQTNGEFA
jgi:hypothetical protein